MFNAPLRCCRKTKCSAFLSVRIKDAIRTVKGAGKSRDFAPEVTDEMLLDPENYGEVFHKHTKLCLETVDSEGLCAKTRHHPECYKKTDQQLKVSYFRFNLHENYI